MTLFMPDFVGTTDSIDECAELRSKIAAANGRAASATRLLEERRMDAEAALRVQLQDSGQALELLETQFATAIELVRDAAKLEVARILSEGQHELSARSEQVRGVYGPTDVC